MRAVLQRVSRASVRVEGQTTGEIGWGWLSLVGVEKGDAEKDAEWLAEKTANLRGFSDDQDKMNRNVMETGGSVLAISQFTLLGDCRTGRRPSFTDAADPATGERLYLHYVEKLRQLGLVVALGVFRSDMKVELINDGPVTFLLDSRKRF